MYNTVLDRGLELHITRRPRARAYPDAESSTWYPLDKYRTSNCTLYATTIEVSFCTEMKALAPLALNARVYSKE